MNSRTLDPESVLLVGGPDCGRKVQNKHCQFYETQDCARFARHKYEATVRFEGIEGGEALYRDIAVYQGETQAIDWHGGGS